MSGKKITVWYEDRKSDADQGFGEWVQDALRRAYTAGCTRAILEYRHHDGKRVMATWCRVQRGSEWTIYAEFAPLKV